LLNTALTNPANEDTIPNRPIPPEDLLGEPTNGSPGTSGAALPWRIDVAVQTPAHSALGDVLSYGGDAPLPAGTLVRVPLGRREVLGVVWHAEIGRSVV